MLLNELTSPPGQEWTWNISFICELSAGTNRFKTLSCPEEDSFPEWRWVNFFTNCSHLHLLSDTFLSFDFAFIHGSSDKSTGMSSSCSTGTAIAVRTIWLSKPPEANKVPSSDMAIASTFIEKVQFCNNIVLILHSKHAQISNTKGGQFRYNS